jgi:mitochondrial fission protein ELM1
LIDQDYLKSQSDKIIKSGIKINKDLVIGLMLGGDSDNFHLSQVLLKTISVQLKVSLEQLDAELLITTSRRTPKSLEGLLKEEFAGYSRCKLLVIANQENIPEAVGGILALSEIIIVSPESISMISEAVNSAKYVIVIDSPDISRKHRRFLDLFAENKYIYLAKPDDLLERISQIWTAKPEVKILKDNLLVSDALKRIL